MVLKPKHTADYWIKHLKLTAHPEGGFYKESYRSTNTFTPIGFSGSRSYSTSIYFLLEKGNVSHFHRIQSDEIWYYHDGSPLTIPVIFPNGTLNQFKLGSDIEKGEQLQIVVPAGSIFGSYCSDGFSLVGCMVSPGFDFEDFELFTTNALTKLYPQHSVIIKKLTKESY